MLGVVAALEGSAAAEPGECASLRRENVASCSVQRSAQVRADREEAAAASGRRVAAAPLFPSNPQLTVSAARRGGTGGQEAVLNYYATLSQEIEIAGQRSQLRRAADSDVEAKRSDLVASTRRAAADGYAAYFEAIAAREALVVARLLDATATQIAKVTRGRADGGVTSPLDAETAEAAALRVTQGRLAAERDTKASLARLSALLGRTSVSVDGELTPLRGADALATAVSTTRFAERPEVRALAHARSAFEARAEAFRRARVPTLSVQLYAQNDGFNERVLGAGLSLPIPLPQPLGRLYTGEIGEAEALARRLGASSEALTRTLSAELAVAVATYESRRAESELYTEERARRAERLLEELGKEIEAGRLAVRDALVAEQQLIDVLRGTVEARRALCLASVELAYAAGVPLEGEPR